MNTNNDRQHLRLLSIFHYIVGGIIAFFSLIFLGHFFIGISMITSPESFPTESSGAPLPKEFGYLFAAIGGTMVLLGEALAISTIFSGRFLSRHKKYWFSFVIACILCVFTPFGTILGVFTIIVLSRQSVKELYGLSSGNNSASNHEDRD
jgi:lysylphosphatidylglycerol synthetase-like protein (DUF2156 family)